MSAGRVYITPIYASGLQKAIAHVIDSLNQNDPTATWKALETLYGFSPPEVQKEVEKLYREIQKQARVLTSPRSIQTAGLQLQASLSLNKFLHQRTHEFFQKISKSLWDKGYLKIKTHETPSNVPKTFFEQ